MKLKSTQHLGRLLSKKCEISSRPTYHLRGPNRCLDMDKFGFFMFLMTTWFCCVLRWPNLLYKMKYEWKDLYLLAKVLLKYGFCNKSFRKDEPLTSWTLFSTYLSSLLGGFVIAPKVIYTKHSKHWPYTVAHTIECVCIQC